MEGCLTSDLRLSVGGKIQTLFYEQPPLNAIMVSCLVSKMLRGFVIIHLGVTHVMKFLSKHLKFFETFLKVNSGKDTTCPE